MARFYDIRKKNAMRFSLFAIALIWCSVSFSQSGSGNGYAAGKGTWIASLGWEGGIYFNDVETNLFGYDTTFTDTAGAVFFPVSIEYCFSNLFSAGIQYKRGRYIEDEAYQSNATGVFDVFVNFHFLKKERNDLYARLSVGAAGLTIEDDEFDSKGEWTGSHAGFSLGYRHFFGKTLGAYVTLGRSAYVLNQKSLTALNTTIDPEDFKWDLTLSGYEFGIGLVARF
jgi:hypothetical protein